MKNKFKFKIDKLKIDKLKLKSWASQTRAHFFDSPKGFGAKLKHGFENFPSLIECLKKIPKFRFALFCLLAFLLADAMMLGLSTYLTPKEAPAKRARERVVELEARILRKADYNAIIAKNIFCPGCPIPDLEIKKIEKPKDCNLAQPAAGNIKLIGTIVLSDPQHSVATLSTGSDAIAVQRGDRVGNVGEVFEIRQGRVCILNADEDLLYVDLPIEEIKFGAPIQNAASSGSIERPVTKVEGIEQVKENEFNISRTTLLEKLADPNLLFQAHAVPHRGQDGSIEGFKILSIQPGSVYESLGVRVGDVIKGVDGEPLDSITKAQELYMTMKTASELNISVDRNGKTIDSKFSIK